MAQAVQDRDDARAKLARYEKAEAEAAAPAGGLGITRAAFAKIENGMPYKDVAAIVGVNGEIASETKQEGIPGVSGPLSIVIITWQNDDGSNMMVTFQNGRVQSKAQAGLK